jgi:hypothetical protein
VKLNPEHVESDEAAFLSAEEAAILTRLDHKLSDEDKYLLSIAKPDQRGPMFVRLEALAALRSGEIDVEEASRRAQVSSPTFYRLRKAWDVVEGRGLRLVSGSIGRNPRGASKRGVRDEARRHALDLLKNEVLADLPVKTLARLVRRATKDGISLEVAEAVVRSVRLDQSRSMVGADETAFGRELVIDACAVSMTIFDDEGAVPRQAILATVMEVSTGLILAGVLCTEQTSVQGQAQAIGLAVATLKWHSLDVWREKPTRLTVAVGPAADPVYDHFVQVLNESIGEENVKAEGPRRFGRSTIAVIGRRLGRLLLLPASTQGSTDGVAPGRAAKNPHSFKEASAIVMQSVKKHNQPILELLRKKNIPASAAGERVQAGRMIEALNQAMPISRHALRGAAPFRDFRN